MGHLVVVVVHVGRLLLEREVDGRIGGRGVDRRERHAREEMSGVVLEGRREGVDALQQGGEGVGDELAQLVQVVARGDAVGTGHGDEWWAAHTQSSPPGMAS